MTSQLFSSLIAGIFVSAAAGYLGSLMVSKRMALVGDALGHVALPGMGLALLLGFDVSLGAFVFLLLGIILIWLLEGKTGLPSEALVGIVFVASLALGFLIVPEPELLEALFGDITKVSAPMALIAAAASIALFCLVQALYPRFILVNISSDLAESEGVRAKYLNLVYLLSIAVLVALGVKIVGSLLIGALVIVPAVAARNVSKNLKEYVWASIFFGIASGFIGIMIASALELPTGPMIVLCSTGFFLISLLSRK
jgi:ABC-type Mn2+/Zn2+ transport system permease subunit